MTIQNTCGIYHDFYIHASLNEVYDAITLPVHLVNWWPLECRGEPKAGIMYRFYFGPKYDWEGIVAIAEKNTSFYVNMIKTDEDWEGTRFGFDLKGDGERTLVRFSHVNWRSRSDHYRIASFCWAMLLNGLKNYVEKSEIIPFEDRS